MKKIFIILLIAGIKFNALSQSNPEAIGSIKIYSVECDLKTKFPYTMDIFKEYYKYVLEIKKNNLDVMFMNYNDCTKKLSSQKELILPDSIPGSKKSIHALVELTFDNKKKVQLFFDREGNYYFQNKWHIRNNGMYYLLFKYFSDTIVCPPVIEEAKKNYKDRLWYGD